MNILQKIRNKLRRLVNISTNQDKIYTNNPSQEYLFMGGSNDGRFITIPDNQWQTLLPINIPPNYDIYNGPNPFRNEIYYKHIMATRNSRLAIYVHSNIPENQILDKLVENYGRK